MRLPAIPIGSSLLSVLLVLSALLFAWLRSGPAVEVPAVATMTPSSLSGAEVWANRCAGCHGEGESRGNAIPALQDFVVQRFSAEGGREYLIDFLFDGRVRKTQNGTVSFSASHPVFETLANPEAAAVLNHMLTSWGNAARLPATATLYTAEEVAARR